MAAAQVLDECMASAHHLGRAKPFQFTHRFEPGLEPVMIGFDGVVRILLHDVARRRQQLIDHPRVGHRSRGACRQRYVAGCGPGTSSGTAPSTTRSRVADADRLAVPGGVDRNPQVDCWTCLVSPSARIVSAVI